MSKRKLGGELIEGLSEIRDYYDGKLTLRTHSVELPKVKPLRATEIKNVREQLSMSQAVFAAYLGLNKRTLERWERGQSKPSDATAVLIRMVHRYPDTIDRIRSVLEGQPTARRKLGAHA